MTRAEDLLQALNGLQRAADSELSGDAREAASQYIKELFRFAGFDGEDAGEGRGEEAVSFAQALAEVRTQAEGELSGNAFDLASIIFDDLASLSPSSASAPQEHAREAVEHGPAAEPAPPYFSEPASETPVESARTEAALSAASFNEVGAASKARVEEVAASLGIGIARPSPPRLRSPGAPAVVGVIEAASAREVAEAAHDFGIPAAAAGQAPEYAAPHAEPALQAVAPVEFRPEVIVTKAEPRSASTARAATPIRPAKTIETASKPQHNEPDKTFFNLWFDMVIGRKR
jgi:hypothetical protein